SIPTVQRREDQRMKLIKTYIKIIASLFFMISRLYLASKFHYHLRTENLREVVVEIANPVAESNGLEKSKKIEYVDKLSRLGYTNIKIDSPEIPVPFKSVIAINVQVDPPFLSFMRWAWKDETIQRRFVLAR